MMVCMCTDQDALEMLKRLALNDYGAIGNIATEARYTRTMEGYCMLYL